MDFMDKMFNLISKTVADDENAPLELKATTKLSIDMREKTRELMEVLAGKQFNNKFDKQFQEIIYHCDGIFAMIDEIVGGQEDTTVLTIKKGDE